MPNPKRKNLRRKPARKKTAFDRRVYPPAQTQEEARAAMMRMMCDIQDSWKECPLPLCRRARACHGKKYECNKPGPPASAHERAKASYELGKMLDIAIARRDRRRAEEAR